MLTFAEELLLLAHDEASGNFAQVQDLVLNTALAGAVLMDLALLNRIDTDVSDLIILDRTATGEKLLDHGLAVLAALPGTSTTTEALDLLRKEGGIFEELAIASLIERGILREDRGHILWVFATRRYPLIDGKELLHVKHRIAELLFSDTLPDPRDVVIIALAQSCGLLRRMLSDNELRRAHPRVEQLAKLDLIGQATAATMQELNTALIRLLPYS